MSPPPSGLGHDASHLVLKELLLIGPAAPAGGNDEVQARLASGLEQRTQGLHGTQIEEIAVVGLSGIGLIIPGQGIFRVHQRQAPVVRAGGWR